MTRVLVRIDECSAECIATDDEVPQLGESLEGNIWLEVGGWVIYAQPDWDKAHGSHKQLKSYRKGKAANRCDVT